MTTVSIPNPGIQYEGFPPIVEDHDIKFSGLGVFIHNYPFCGSTCICPQAPQLLNQLLNYCNFRRNLYRVFSRFCCD